VSSSPTGGGHLTDDERLLAELGYKQELERSWGGFTNFAISFSIISILSGCFTTYYVAWDYGGPIAISIGWPLIWLFTMVIALCMAEIVSAYPTAGGLYYWSSKLGGPGWGWFTGWFNLVGVIAIVAGVDYGCATFTSATIGLFDSSWTGGLRNIFYIFVAILVVHTLVNLFPAHILSWWNNISAYWHLIGAAVVVLVLAFDLNTPHQSLSFVFTHTVNNSGFAHHYFWFYILPLGFLMTQYTITGYDASAHLSEETSGAAKAAAQGLWRSVFYAGVTGYILLLAFTFAAHNVGFVNGASNFHGAANAYGAGSVISIFASSLGLTAFKLVMVISAVGQFFCGGAGMTSASRMMFAFSRDRAVPGHQLWSKVASNKAPRNASLAVAVISLLITAPALKGNHVGVPVAFFAVVSVTTIGLYVAYTIPVYLRWRMGDEFKAGPWTLGNRYKWMCPLAFGEVIVVSIYFMLPTAPAGWPGNSLFDWSLVNYAPILLVAVIGFAGIWWMASAKNWFKGPIRTVELPTEVGD
jgi:amino acid transporter